MQDFFLADWGDNALDVGHLKHREVAGMQIVGLHTDGAVARTSNFMDHGSLSVKIRQEDYRPFLLNLYALVCYAADSGNFYSPEDAYIPGSYAGEGNEYGWAAVINSALQPTVGLRCCFATKNGQRCLPPAEGRSETLVCKRPNHFRRPLPHSIWRDQLVHHGHCRPSLENQTRLPPGFQRRPCHSYSSQRRASLQTASAGKIVNNSIRLPRATLAAQLSHFEIDVD